MKRLHINNQQIRIAKYLPVPYISWYFTFKKHEAFIYSVFVFSHWSLPQAEYNVRFLWTPQ